MYNHPYEPYDIQMEFMNTLYHLLCSTKKVGIFESPTGTGKTLSLVCPSITWLRNLDKIALDKELAKVETLKGPPFLKVAARKKLLANYQEQGEALKALQAKLKSSISKDYPEKKFKLSNPLPEDFYLANPVVDVATDELVQEILEDAEPSELGKLYTGTKIYFTSRTHSQLSQLVDSLKHIKVEAIWSDSQQPMKHVPLASRKQLCTNPDVKKLSSARAINDRCQELRQAHGCPYYEKNRQELRERIITEIMDIEDLVLHGHKSKCCSYYAAREALPYAEVVTLPYQLLMQSTTRKTLGINLKDSLVIVDEAHNLMDVIASLNSATITRKDVSNALTGLHLYKEKVYRRLSTQNKTRLDQTILVVESINKFFEIAHAKPAKETSAGQPLAVSELFAAKKNVDMINLWELKEWFAVSKLTFKIDSYIRQAEIKGADSLILAQVVEFLVFATDPSNNGKLFYDRRNGELCVSFLSLDPSPSFQEVVDGASKVVLAGGTMEPIDEYRHTLFPYIAPDDLVTFSCGHIVPQSSILVRIVSGFEFTFQKRNDKAMIFSLGQLVLSLIKKVPQGFVLFFPSYSYLDQVAAQWKERGIYQDLGSQKRIFTEDKNKSVEAILSSYAKHIGSGKGALMFAVVGGKLSEGINFSDDLARGVAMIGLPFPNAFSAEMIAKREFLINQALARGQTKVDAMNYAKDHYENLSMRAVNQSVGRAIRHIRDYSAIYLIDDRYSQHRIKSKLSGWLRDCVESGSTYLADTVEFFKDKQ